MLAAHMSQGVLHNEKGHHTLWPITQRMYVAMLKDLVIEGISSREAAG